MAYSVLGKSSQQEVSPPPPARDPLLDETLLEELLEDPPLLELLEDEDDSERLAALGSESLVRLLLYDSSLVEPQHGQWLRSRTVTDTVGGLPIYCKF